MTYQQVKKLSHLLLLYNSAGSPKAKIITFTSIFEPSHRKHGNEVFQLSVLLLSRSRGSLTFVAPYPRMTICSRLWSAVLAALLAMYQCPAGEAASNATSHLHSNSTLDALMAGDANVTLTTETSNFTLNVAEVHAVVALLGQLGLGGALPTSNATSGNHTAVGSTMQTGNSTLAAKKPPTCDVGALCNMFTPCPAPCKCSNVQNPKIAGRCNEDVPLSSGVNPLLAGLTG